MNFLEKLSVKSISIILCLVIGIGIVLRLQNFHLLPIDAHPMRQTDTESVAYNFAFRNSNILYPQNSLIRPQTNTNAYFFLEFPTYEYGMGMLYKLFGWHIEVARIYNLFLYVLSTLLLYYVVKKLWNITTGLFSITLFTLLPASIFFLGHAIHPDIFATTTLIGSLASYLYFKDKKNILFFVISIISLGLSVATRPFIVIVLPAFLFLLWQKKARIWEYPFLILGAFGLYGLWKYWQLQFEGTDHSWENWILFGRERLFTYEGFVQQLLLKNVIGEVIGKATSVFALIGVLSILLKRNAMTIFLFLWFMGIPVYWYMVPNGNMIHQYYANIFIIPVVITAALGLTFISSLLEKFTPRYISLSILISLLIVTAYNGYRTSNHFFNNKESESHLIIAREIDKVIPMDKKIVYLATLNSVPFSLYHRQGWMLGAPPVDVDANADGVIELKKHGDIFIVYAKDNTSLPQSEIQKIEKATTLFYSSPS